MNLAILDFDYTLYQGRSRYELAKAMEEAQVIGKGLTKELDELEQKYLQGEIGYNQMYKDDKAIFAKYYKDLKRTQAMQFLDQELDLSKKMSSWSKDLIKLLEEKGYLTVIVSGSWDFIIEKAQEILGFDSFFASEFVLNEGKFTGEYKHIFDFAKKQTVTKQLIESCDYSIGFGDSVADLVFLRAVDQGFVCNPRQDMLDQMGETDLVIVNDDNIIDLVKEAL
ncbi:MAG: hypothetical protein Fur003_5950 [Candidatus Dojkabacteria bacterium]